MSRNIIRPPWPDYRREPLPFDGAEEHRETVRRLYGVWLDRLETALRAAGVGEGQRADVLDAMRGEAR